MQLPVGSTRLNQVCKENNISFLGVFGSYARGKASETSDIDLLAHFAEKKSLTDLVRVERELSQVLGRSVDLVTENSLSPYLKEKIKSELRIIYEQG